MTHPVREALLRRDLEGLIDQLDPDVEIHGPSQPAVLRGHDVARLLFGRMIDVLEDPQLDGEFTDGTTTVLILRGRLAGRHVEWVDVLEAGDDGRIVRIRVFSRPGSAAAQFAVALGPAIAGGPTSAAGAVVSSRVLFCLVRGFEAMVAFGLRRAHPR